MNGDPKAVEKLSELTEGNVCYRGANMPFSGSEGSREGR